jgi:CheY-like chemotaxis protein
MIIMDLTMPRMSGRDAFRQILKINPFAKVLFSSGYSAEELSDVSGAVGLLAIGALSGMPMLLAVGLVWCAHIGFDRLLGYGLKYGAGFAYTHLGRIGPQDPW